MEIEDVKAEQEQSRKGTKGGMKSKIIKGGSGTEAEGKAESESAAKSKISRISGCFSSVNKWFKGNGAADDSEDEKKDTDLVEDLQRESSSASQQAPTVRSRLSVQEALRKATSASMFVKASRLLRAALLSDKRMLPKHGSMSSGLAGEVEDQSFNLRNLQNRVYDAQYYCMVIAMVGLMSGIAVNEYCWLGYIPTLEEQAGFCSDSAIASQSMCIDQGLSWSDGLSSPLDAEDGGRCMDAGGNGLKAISTALTVVLLLAIFHMYECMAIELCMRNHLEYRRPFVNTPFWEMGLLPEFVIECAVCIIHPSPGLEYFVTVQARGRISVYNVESMLVTAMFVRLYHVWRYFREWLFARYTSKNFASRMNDVPMDSKLAIKAILDDKPFHTVLCVFFVAVLVLAYLVRIAESPVNLQHVYFWNQLWLIVVTATSTGYGDLYPLSHLGRFVCFLAMMLGIVLTAILIATTSNKLAFNASEARLMRFLHGEKWEREIKGQAVQCIQSWWRRSLQHPRTLAALRAFRTTKRRYRKFLEATPHFGTFVENMTENHNRVAETLDKIEHSVGIHGVPPRRVADAVAAVTGTAVAAPAPGQLFEDVMLELAQLRKTNEQLRTMVEKSAQRGLPNSNLNMSDGQRPSAEALSAALNMVSAQAGRHSSAAGGGGGNREEAARVASEAVEERVRRLETQVTNFDKGMARCFAQVVRLIQGLY